jgi:hypothetical protein
MKISLDSRLAMAIERLDERTRVTPLLGEEVESRLWTERSEDLNTVNINKEQ